MTHETVPNHGLEGLRVRRHLCRIDRRYDHHGMAYLLRVAAIAAHDSQNPEVAPPRFVERTDQVRTDIPLEVTPAHRHDENSIVRIGSTGPKPCFKYCFPALII